MSELIRLRNGKLARLLHDQLYERLLNFCNEYAKEFPGELVVEDWLRRLYSGDSNIHILVNLNDDYIIVGHAVIEMQELYGVRILHCYQIQGDKKSVAEISYGVEYIDKLAAEVGARYTSFYVQRSTKAIEKYGYRPVRVAMLKEYNNE